MAKKSKYTVKSLRAEAKQRRIKGWYRMPKSQLMSALGKSGGDIKKAARGRRAMIDKRTIDTVAKKQVGAIGGNTQKAKAALKKKAMDAVGKYKAKNPNATSDQLRKVAGQAIVKEARKRKKTVLSNDMTAFNKRQHQRWVDRATTEPLNRLTKGHVVRAAKVAGIDSSGSKAAIQARLKGWKAKGYKINAKTVKAYEKNKDA